MFNITRRYTTLVNMNKKKKILDGHKKVGTKFVPPAKHLIPQLGELSWVENLLPELIWIGVLIEKYGNHKGIELSSYFSSISYDIIKSDKPSDFSFISSFKFITEEEKQALINKLREKEYFNDISAALDPFIKLYSQDNPLAFLQSEKMNYDREKSIEEFKATLNKYFNRRLKPSMIIQTNVLYSTMRAGKMHIAAHIEVPDFNAIVVNFESEDAKKAMGFVRSHVNAVYAHISETITNQWCEYFWNNGLELEELKISSIVDQENKYEGEDVFFQAVSKYEMLVNQAVTKRWNKLPKEIFHQHIIEVIGAILARQASLAKRIARNPENWDFHIGPILLRGMIDVHITLAWILKNPDEATKKFIEYGLGQEKLQIEHLEDESDENDDKPLLDILIDARKSWLTDQRYAFLTTVNIGSWSGISTRDMAEDSGCRNLYRFAYTPFSSCAHSMWNHIGKFNVQHSDNPLHKHIRLPFDPEIPPQPETLINSAKYLLKTFEAIDVHFKINEDDFNPVNFWYDYFDSIKNSEVV